MPIRFTELQLTPEAVEVLKASGIGDVDALAGANVTDLQEAFILAAKENRYPDKFPSLVKIAAWVEQARTVAERQPEGGPSTDLDNIPTAVVKPAAKKKAYRGSGPSANVRQVELRPDRHRPKKDVSPSTTTTGDRITVTPRRDEPIGDVLEELNPDRLRILHNRRQSPTLMKTSGAETPPAAEPTPAAEPIPATSPPSPSELKEQPPEPVQAEPLVQAVAPSEPAPAQKKAPSEEEAPQPAAAFRSFDDYKEGRVAVKPLDRHSLQLGEDTERSTGTEQESFEDEIVYKKKMPIWRIRGVQHPDGLKVYLGAFITFITVLMVILIGVGAAMFPFYEEAAEYRMEFAAMFGVTLLLGVIYLFMAIGMRCRVCSCHLFYSRRCLKNKKAHSILGAFPMFAQTLHILAWRWFRCMYCGTAVRLRGDRE